MTELSSLDPERHALFLDFDGTLVEFADDPRTVAIRPAVLDRLTAVQKAFGGAFAVISGRRITQLDHFLAPMRFAAAGVHGLEQRIRPDGETVDLAGRDSMDGIRQALAVPLGLQPDILLEDKGTAIVLHYRSHPELAGIARAMMAAAVGDRPGFDVLHGNCVVEVHPGGMNKGRAVAGFMESEPFAGRIPVYVGDDATDEFAFRAVNDLAGVSIKVGEGDSAAALRLPDVAAVHRWLGARQTVH